MSSHKSETKEEKKPEVTSNQTVTLPNTPTGPQPEEPKTKQDVVETKTPKQDDAPTLEKPKPKPKDEKKENKKEGLEAIAEDMYNMVKERSWDKYGTFKEGFQDIKEGLGNAKDKIGSAINTVGSKLDQAFDKIASKFSGKVSEKEDNPLANMSKPNEMKDPSKMINKELNAQKNEETKVENKQEKNEESKENKIEINKEKDENKDLRL